MIRRAALLWLAVFALYAATLGIDSFGRSDYGGQEPHFLLTAKSLVDDGSPDLTDEYRTGAYESFYPYPLEPHGTLTERRLNEPHGVGFPLLIAPAWAIGGETAVELWLAALAALAVALAYLLALRAVPDPWALGATLGVAISPPLLAYSTAVYPEMAAAAMLAGATLLALRLDEHPTRPTAIGCFALLGTLPWLGPRFIPAGIVVAAIALRALRRAGRPWVALVSVEVIAFSVATYLAVSDGFYGGPTPHSAGLGDQTGTGADSAAEYAERAYRLIALLVDREFGLLRWAPVFALAMVGAWLILRERRGRLAHVIPALRREEQTIAACTLVAGVQVLVAAFLAPTMFGFWFPGRHLVAVLPLAAPLVALALRRLPRVGAGLIALTAGASAWLYADLRFGGGSWVGDRPDAPWGPLEDAFPLFEDGATAPFVAAAVLGVGLCAALALAVRGPRWRALRGSLP